jgi:uncharacterized protein
VKRSTGLAVFAKFPEPGKVKTRLAKSVGADEAADIYVRLLGHFVEHTLSKVPGIEVTWFCDPGRPLADCRDLFAFTGFAVEPQAGADLGARMKDALGKLLDRHDRALVVGTDCIDVTPEILESASDKLGHSDLVVGPTGDGGYYLLGLKRIADSLFGDIPWSTPKVLPLTLERAKALKWEVAELQPLRDVDTASDWKALGFRCDGDNEAIRNLRRRKT